MAERIYVMMTNKSIEPLEETAFGKEATLQTLIAEHPELLDGEQMRPGDPRRWLLISREKGISAAPGEGARWAGDDRNAQRAQDCPHITGESITGYFLELLAERARSEGDDAISTLAREAARGELINTTEAADMLGVIMIAGNETTANLIGNGLWALMRHPDEMERLREEPERARDAITEVLRYDSPVQTDFRIAKCEAVIGGKTIRTGEGVILLTGSANRDEAAFSEPDRLDIERKGPKHAAFGQRFTPSEAAAARPAVVLAPVTARADEHLAPASGTEKQSGIVHCSSRRGGLDDPRSPGNTALGAVRKCGSGRSLGRDRQVSAVRGCVSLLADSDLTPTHQRCHRRYARRACPLAGSIGSGGKQRHVPGGRGGTIQRWFASTGTVSSRGLFAK